MGKLKAIIFDFDGIILESVDVKTWAFEKLFERYPGHLLEILRYHMENGGVSRFIKFRYIYKSILRKPLTKDLFDRLCRRYSRLVYQRVVGAPFVPGALGLLKKYSKRCLLFVISGTPQKEMARIIKDKCLSGYFTEVFGSPGAKSLWTKRILKQYRLNPKETVFVGDAMSDYQAALANKILFVGRVPKGEDDIFKLKKARVKHRIRDLRELEKLLSKKFNGKK